MPKFLSFNAHKYYRRLAKHQARIANQRRDFLQKTTTEISRNYAHIRIEDLNVAGMMANHKLYAAIGDARILRVSTAFVLQMPMYATKLELVDRWYPSFKTCNNCHHIQPMLLSERVVVCHKCGHTIERDLAAAINLALAPN